MKLKKENNIPGAKSEVEIFNPTFVLSKTGKFKTGFFSTLEFCLLKAEKNKLNFFKKLWRLYLTYIIYLNRSAFVIACFPINIVEDKLLIVKSQVFCCIFLFRLILVQLTLTNH